MIISSLYQQCSGSSSEHTIAFAFPCHVVKNLKEYFVIQYLIFIYTSTFFAHERVDGIVRSFARHLPFQGTLVRQWNKKTRDSVGRIVATTNFAAEEFEQLGLTVDHSPKAKLVSVPLGVDLEKFDPRIRDVENKAFAYFPENYIFACTRL